MSRNKLICDAYVELVDAGFVDETEGGVDSGVVKRVLRILDARGPELRLPLKNCLVKKVFSFKHFIRVAYIQREYNHLAFVFENLDWAKLASTYAENVGDIDFEIPAEELKNYIKSIINF